MGCYTGPHADFYNCVCLDYAGGFTEFDADDPIEAFMAQFLKEEVEIQMPKEVRSWKQKSRISVKG